MLRPIRIPLVFVLFLTGAIFSRPAEAVLTAIVTPTVTPEGGGSYLYSYDLTNSPTSTSNIGAFDLVTSASANLSSINFPTGFLALYTPGDSFIEFASTDPSTDLIPGASDLFSFTAAVAPASGAFAARSYDPPFDEQDGTTLTPTGVPEPGSLCVVGLGAFALMGRRKRRQTGG